MAQYERLRIDLWYNEEYSAHKSEFVMVGPQAKSKNAKLSVRLRHDVRLAARKFSPMAGSPAAMALEEAREAGLLEGGGTRHVSFRAPNALVEAALKQAGVSSTTELGLSALALMAQPDPAAAFLKRTRGRLGADHTLEY